MLKINNEGELNIFVEYLNKIIEEAIIHGGDSGGAYCMNEDNLVESIQRFLNWTGLNKYLFIYKDDFPKILEKAKTDLVEKVEDDEN